MSKLLLSKKQLRSWMFGAIENTIMVLSPDCFLS